VARISEKLAESQACLVIGHLDADREVVAMAHEQKIRHDTVLPASRRRLKHHLVVQLEGAAPAEGRFPEAGKARRVSSIDAEALDAEVHVSSLLAATTSSPPISESVTGQRPVYGTSQSGVDRARPALWSGMTPGRTC
jgi:hypothetical protein